MHQKNNNEQDSPWLLTSKTESHPRLRLFCFHHAGGGASVFRQWGEMMPQGIEVCAVQPPGHEHRINEPLFCNMNALITAMVDELPIGSSPFALFGHSMGAKIAYAFARKLKSIKNREPVQMFLSASRAPHVPEPLQRHQLEDKAFMQQICKLGGTPEAILASQEYMFMLLPVFRADFTIDELYICQEDQFLTCPFTLFRGSKDDEVNDKDLEQWKAHTTGATQLETIEGDHFFFKSQEKKLTDFIARQLVAALTSNND